MTKKIFQGAVAAACLLVALTVALHPVFASSLSVPARTAPVANLTIIGGAMLNQTDLGVALVSVRGP